MKSDVGCQRTATNDTGIKPRHCLRQGGKLSMWRKPITKLSKIVFLGIVFLFASNSYRSAAQQPARDVAQESARPARDWERDGVIYEIYPRAFSAEGNFRGITAQLERLKNLAVTILWLIPIHSVRQVDKKGSD